MALQTEKEVITAYAAWAEFFLDLRNVVRSGSGLIGLGEVIRFFERVADEFAELDDGETVDVECAVTVEAVLRQGEGTLIVSAELSEDGFILSETSNDYDSYSRRHFAWEPCFGIEFNDCHEWRETFLDVLRQGYLSIERLDD